MLFHDHKIHIEKELRKLRRSLAQATNRPGVTTEELDNLRKNIKIHEDIMDLIKEAQERR